MKFFERPGHAKHEPRFTDEELQKCYTLKTDNSLIHIDFLRQIQNQKEQKRLGDLVVGDILKIFQTRPRETFSLLLDIRSIQQGAFFYLPAAMPYRDLAIHPQFARAAAVTTGTLLTPLIEIFVRNLNQGNRIRVFKRESDARRWLDDKNS